MKNVFALLILFLVLVFSGCGEDDWTEKNVVNNNKEGFSLSYTIPGAITAVTRATVPNEQGEDRINSLYILFFENRANGNGEFVAAIDAMAAYTASLGSSGTLEIELSSPLKDGAEYKMLFCANIDEYAVNSFAGIDDLKAMCQGQTEAQVASMLLEVSAANGMRPDNLPMSATAVKVANQKNISIELIRVVSRFDVYSNVDGYELVSASLWNVYPESRIWQSDVADFSKNRIGFYYSVEAQEGNKIAGSLYAFENYVETPSQNDEMTTCLILGLKEEGTDDVRYYRMNIHPEDKKQDLKRNNVYRSTISNVLDTGALTEQEAYENPVSLLNTDINGWTVDANGSVVYDDENILALPTTLITLQGVGQVREDQIFTNGPGTLTMTKEGIPSDVTVELFDHVLYIYAPESSVEWTGTLHFSIGNLTNSLTISQGNYLSEPFLDLSFDVEDLPAFGYKAGEVSPEIDVTSSGAWVAEIYNGNYISFGNSATQVTRITGEANSSFSLSTIAENTSSADRYCFVVVSLAGSPEINRALVLRQTIKPDEYILFNPGKTLKVVGKSSIRLRLESNIEWEVSYTALGNYYGENITFKESGKTTMEGSNDEWITVVFPTKENPNYTAVQIQAKGINGYNKSTSQLLYWYATGTADPEPTPEPTPVKRLFVSNGTGIGNLVNPGTDGYNWYVYGLGQNLRNTGKFGKNGTMAKTGKDNLEYTSSLNSASISDAHIIQLLSNPSSSVFNRIYERMQADPTVFLMITSRDPVVINSILTQFKAKTNAKYGSAVNISNYPANVRPFNTAVTHPLMNYLLNGPGGRITNASQITLQSSVGQVGAALPPAAYPSTFVPVIKSNAGNDYCVFGIDPVHRLIIMTDPGIFGAHPNLTAYPSYKNFLSSGTPNSIFLDNLTAWIINATGKDNFLNDFR